MLVGISVTASTGNPICVRDYSGSYHSPARTAPYLRNPVIRDPGNVKSFGASLINCRNGANLDMRTSCFASALPQVTGDRVQIKMLLEVQRNALLLLTDKLRQYAKHYRRLSAAFVELTNMDE